MFSIVGCRVFRVVENSERSPVSVATFGGPFASLRLGDFALSSETE
jgi:hypothetical protein